MPTMQDAVFEKISNVFSKERQIKISITEIDEQTLNSWTQTWKQNNQRKPPNGGWDWDYKTKDMSKKYEKRLISIAIWVDNTTLCGLALCQRSKGSETISIHYIERSPDNTEPLKGYIFKIVEAICLEYAILTKKTKTIRIIQPVDNLIALYQENGFKAHKKLLSGRKYCEKFVKTNC
jgi:hypothetical protein